MNKQKKNPSIPKSSDNPKHSKLYLDSDQVKRGYYVYLHRDLTTDEVFYIGKGHGNRAWDKRRNQLWKEKVDSLGDKWQVEIIKDDLSEIEAFEYEEEYVEKHGGHASEGGCLTNWIPGDEEPGSFKITLNFGEAAAVWDKTYEELRAFKEYDRPGQEEIASKLQASLKSVITQLEELEDLSLGDIEGEEESEDDELYECVLIIKTIADDLDELSYELLNHRISWKEFCLGVDQSQDDLELEKNDKIHEKFLPVTSLLSDLLNDVYHRIDSGNKQEAMLHADKAEAEFRSSNDQHPF